MAKERIVLKKMVVCLAVLIGGAQAAQASGYIVTYKSRKLVPAAGEDGIRGAKRLMITWSIPKLPNPGACIPYGVGYLTSYTDGRNTLQSLLTKYQYDPNHMPNLEFCVNRKSQVQQGSAFYFPVFTNVGGENYSEYYTFVQHRRASISITFYKNGAQKRQVADIGNGGGFSVAPE